MINKLITIILVCFGLSIIITCAANYKKGEKEMIDKEIMELMKKLDAIPEREMFQLLDNVTVQRNELLGILLKHLSTSESLNVKAASIYLIGRHRLNNGVNDIVKVIDLDMGEKLRKGPLPLWDRYPSVDALINIGLPAVPPVLDLLASEDDVTRRELALKVMRYLQTPELGSFFLQQFILVEKDPEKKSRLQTALDEYNKLYSGQ
jgi:hypothetical protein